MAAVVQPQMQALNEMAQNNSILMNKYQQLNQIHNISNMSGVQEGINSTYNDDEGDLMLFSDSMQNQINEANYQKFQRQQLYNGQRRFATNNNSVMTNFNPLTALDTYENSGGSDNQKYLQSQNISSGQHSYIPTQRLPQQDQRVLQPFNPNIPQN